MKIKGTTKGEMSKQLPTIRLHNMTQHPTLRDRIDEDKFFDFSIVISATTTAILSQGIRSFHHQCIMYTFHRRLQQRVVEDVFATNIVMLLQRGEGV